MLVTGAASGIAKAIALRLGEERAVVGALDLDAGAAAATTAAEIARRAPRPTRYGADIADGDCRRARGRGVRARGTGPDRVLVNNAGWDRLCNFLDRRPALWDELIAINLRGPLNMHRAVVRGMAERKRGRVVNIASDAGRVGSTGESVYAACKGGIIAFSKSLARELAPAGSTSMSSAPARPTRRCCSVPRRAAEARDREGSKRAIPFGGSASPTI